MAAMDEAKARRDRRAGDRPAERRGRHQQGGHIVGDVHSYRPRKGPLNAREVVVDVMLPIVVLLIGAHRKLYTFVHEGQEGTASACSVACSQARAG